MHLHPYLASMDTRLVTVLFARADSVYKRLPGTDVFDQARDALTFSGCGSVIAHPPCRGWGRLSHFAKVAPGELDLGLFAVDVVRRCGGVLEHPHASKLWKAAGLPLPGSRDKWGGWTLPVYQGHFGHRAPKATWLYVVGVEPIDVPSMPFDLVLPEGRVALMNVREREATPEPFARFLIDIARRVQVRDAA
ncbi:hypothetical protein [Thauera linaloolentis]|uniref:Uncharacterized protein n=1 Tax=Thauera linaloolentis (strain DSM 12138 / JCM 21573 / CCUG 41526 / CIP 105981 / IAM 15112 / NBRC 102519 / 47Lol) TaxID=1123367 RepID=N6YWA3_THAL4|nr:hypothetical protein [Thauera linaloolentis]ENO86707.1 hypothetical protein C666_12660 [Thauera linaloolentis 47Lol = DSM 12138]MCM8566190.1 hypothetical protein [Thauera linaloolentis]